MEKKEHFKSWWDLLNYPCPERQIKPRNRGLTMVIDKGLGLTELKELLDIAADYIDFIKLGFGTSALYPEFVLKEKVKLVRKYGVDIFPGGTFLEVALYQGKVDLFLQTSCELGYSFIEVSDGTISLPPEVRLETILKARELGFGVISEVGKKDNRDEVSLEKLIEQANRDLEAGVYKVIVEGRESGKGVVIYDARGGIKKPELDKLETGLPGSDSVIWEAPLKHQQQELIFKFGPNVNLGNVPPDEVLALEALRVGLRGDTFRNLLSSSAGWGQQCKVPGNSP